MKTPTIAKTAKCLRTPNTKVHDKQLNAKTIIMYGMTCSNMGIEGSGSACILSRKI